MLGITFAFSPLFAQQEVQELAKKSQNPFSNLISLPLENDMTFPVAPGSDIQNVLNIQPVFPVTLGPLNLINRVILPLIAQPETVPGGPSVLGLGDINYQLAISPAKADKFVWGIGPMVIFPSASSPLTGQGKLSVGPLAGVLLTEGPWVGGILFDNVWSVAGNNTRPAVNQMQLQPIFNYNFKRGWFLESSPMLTADWEAPNNNRWTVPVGGGGGRVFKIFSQSISLSTQVFYNTLRPQGSGKVTWCLTLQFLFPKNQE